jgi:hypothetical protein
MATVISNFLGVESLVRTIESIVRPIRGPRSDIERHLRNVCNVHPYVTKQERFDQAVRYAQAQMLDPKAKQFYSLLARRLKITHAYQAAVKDYMKDPEISSIELSNYTGEKRNSIFIESSDYLKISVMIVEIFSAEGTLLESGTAVRKRDEKRWKYLTQVNNPTLAGTCVKAIGIDRPGREVVVDAIL